MKRQQGFQFKKFFYSRSFIVVVLIVIFLLATNLVRTMSRDYKVRSEIRRLENEQTRLEMEQKRLSNLRDLFQSQFFVEEESRKSLGYAKPGEKMIIVEPGAISVSGNEEEEDLSNPQKWYKYFFSRS